MVVMHRGEIVFERYGVQPDTVFGPGGPISADSTLISWSMAKSITHAAVGLLVADGILEVDQPAPVQQWRGAPQEGNPPQEPPRQRACFRWDQGHICDP